MKNCGLSHFCADSLNYIRAISIGKKTKLHVDLRECIMFICKLRTVPTCQEPQFLIRTRVEDDREWVATRAQTVGGRLH